MYSVFRVTLEGHTEVNRKMSEKQPQPVAASIARAEAIEGELSEDMTRQLGVVW